MIILAEMRSKEVVICTKKVLTLLLLSFYVAGTLATFDFNLNVFNSLKVIFYVFLPIVLWASLFYLMDFQRLEEVYVKAFRYFSVVFAMSVVYQYFVSPDLYGYVAAPIYNATLKGTSSFRAIGLAGSPQNAALILSAALFLNYHKYNLTVKLLILIAGMLTLSSFFGFVFMCYLFSISQNKLQWFTILIFITLFVLFGEFFENNFFESFTFNEVLKLNDRFSFEHMMPVNFFGNGLGSSNENFLSYFDNNAHSSESFFLSLIYEQGAVGFLKISFLLTLFFLPRHQHTEIASIYRVMVLNMSITPSFLGVYARLLFLPFIFFLLNQLIIIDKVKHHGKS